MTNKRQSKKTYNKNTEKDVNLQITQQNSQTTPNEMKSKKQQFQNTKHKNTPHWRVDWEGIFVIKEKRKPKAQKENLSNFKMTVKQKKVDNKTHCVEIHLVQISRVGRRLALDLFFLWFELINCFIVGFVMQNYRKWINYITTEPANYDYPRNTSSHLRISSFQSLNFNRIL